MTAHNPEHGESPSEPGAGRSRDIQDGDQNAAAGSAGKSRAKTRKWLERRAARLEAEIARLSEDLFGHLHGGDPTRLKGARPLNLELSGGGGAPPPRPLFDQLLEQTREWGLQARGYVAGRVYCYRCTSTECVHALPPVVGQVFSGYSATGVPQWSDLVQVLLGARHERVDLLYEERPATVALSMPGRELKSQLLHTFGRASKTYDVLGQVVCGYFAPPAGSAERVALSIQVVEWRDQGGRFALNLNVIGLAPGSEASYFSTQERLRRALERARRKVADIERRVRGGGQGAARNAAPLKEVPQLLRALVQDLERQGRQGVRRTVHAQERGAQQRPVHMAIQDLKGAGPDQFFFDEHRKTLVILGARQRVHAFTVEGRHATSFLLDGPAVERRIRRGRWRRATDAERVQLLSAVERQR